MAAFGIAILTQLGMITGQTAGLAVLLAVGGIEVGASWHLVAAPVAAGTAAVGEVVKQGVPAVPEVATKSLENIGAWKRIGSGALEIGREAAREFLGHTDARTTMTYLRDLRSNRVRPLARKA